MQFSSVLYIHSLITTDYVLLNEDPKWLLQKVDPDISTSLLSRSIGTVLFFLHYFCLTSLLSLGFKNITENCFVPYLLCYFQTLLYSRISINMYWDWKSHGMYLQTCAITFSLQQFNAIKNKDIWTLIIFLLKATVRIRTHPFHRETTFSGVPTFLLPSL